ncbi:Xylulose kinase [Eumeta japonica]|uniref:peptidylprolyl isomerase n=1 Tax=Eumeta variegata TaxID=151549 RepID=A0A4C1WPN8_EUMVA|nr:Xylulose kinase [Eumeta japonica]
MNDETRKTFLGFDFSTQRLKALVISEQYEVLQEASVEFDVDLPEFRTAGGVVRGEKGEVYAPPLLWVKALDMVLDRLIVAGVDFSTVEALSGAGQQHGSVWWAKGSNSKLVNLSSDDFLHTQLTSCFVTNSPVWMDSSTTTQCRALEEAVGGAEELAKITGSTAYERFTGSQIKKMYSTRPRIYQATERISLVSSFACSLLVGHIAPIDLSDGSGMNLLNIHTKNWYPEALKACGDDSLSEKLGVPVPTSTIVGNISPYYVQRYGFKPDCRVAAFTGDNCSALAGLRLRSGWVGLSLGTSDTLLLGLQEPAAPPAGHILVGPTPEAPYMALLCFSNGSLTRQSQRDRLVGPSWDDFNDLLKASVRGNMGYMGIYYDTAEIVPRAAPGRWLWDSSGKQLERAAPQFEARALLETQALARRAHAEDMGFKIDESSRIIATGGAAVNHDLLQIFADVFHTPVYVMDEHGNAALLGAAIRAAELWSADTATKLPGSEPTVSPVAIPHADAEKIYSPMLARLCAAAVSLLFGRIGRWSEREIARSALSLVRSAQAERNNESCFFVRADGVHRLIRRSHVKNLEISQRTKLCRCEVRHESAAMEYNRNATEKKEKSGSVICAQYIIRSQLRAAKFRIDITKNNDRGVLKRIIKEGVGKDTPNPGCQVTVHYTGTLLDGTKFDSSRDRNEPFEFQLGKGTVIKAWDIGVATMKKGEVCVLTCAPEYAYGAAGSPPKIPPNATLQFEIEMIDWKVEDLSPNKNKAILRHIIEQGAGNDRPNDGAIVTVELEGRLLPDGKVFDSRTVTFSLGEGSEINICEGIERALEKFQKDEKSRLTIQPKYGFKSEGNAELGVPPNTAVEYIVKLNNFEKAKESWAMDGSEKLDQAKIYKEKGTNYFKSNKFQLAIKMYKRVDSLLNDIPEDMGESEENKQQAKELLLSAHLNLSLVYLKVTPVHHFEARDHANKALKYDSNNVKGLFRRGQALLGLGEAELAMKDFQNVLNVEPNNKAAANQIIICRNNIAKQKQREKQLYANMFDKFAKHDSEMEKLKAKEEVDIIGDRVGEWGEWTDQQRDRKPTDFERENPNILLLDKDGQFENM